MAVQCISQPEELWIQVVDLRQRGAQTSAVVTHVGYAENQIRRELMFDFNVPVLDHTGATITGRQESDSAKTATTSPVVLRGIKIRRRRETRNTRIEKNGWTEASVKVRRRCESIGQGLAEVAIGQRCIIDAVTAANHGLSQESR